MMQPLLTVFCLIAALAGWAYFAAPHCDATLAWRVSNRGVDAPRWVCVTPVNAPSER